jgi:hypothetical protein
MYITYIYTSVGSKREAHTLSLAELLPHLIVAGGGSLTLLCLLALLVHKLTLLVGLQY